MKRFGYPGDFGMGNAPYIYKFKTPNYKVKIKSAGNRFPMYGVNGFPGMPPPPPGFLNPYPYHFGWQG